MALSARWSARLPFLAGCLWLGAPLPATGAGTAAAPGGPSAAAWVDMRVGASPSPPLPLAAGGDVNGDGFADLVVGGPLEEQERGRVLVFYGRREGLGKEPDWILTGDRPHQHLGLLLAVADVNGDRMDDILALEWQGILGEANGTTALHVIRGSAQGLPPRPSQTLQTQVGDFELKPGLDAVGDVNGDGFEDVAVKGWEVGVPQGRSLRVLLLHGSAEGLRGEPAQVLRDDQPESGFGSAVAGAGDVNGDGFDDLVVGAMLFNGRHPGGGRAYLFPGSRDGVSDRPAWTSEYPLPVEPGVDGDKEQFFGSRVAAAGDVNGDGFGDVLVGAWNASHGDIGEGAAFLFLGSSGGLGALPAWWVEGNHHHVLLGASVGAAGDVTGDGLDDVVIGVPYASNGQKDEGVALVYAGTRGQPALRLAWAGESDRSNGHLGGFASAAGDVNGDGWPDLVLAGSDTAEGPEPRVRVVVVHGQAGGLPGSSTSTWRPRKPVLAALQQRLDRVSRGGMAVAVAAGALVLAGGLLAGQARLRRRLRSVIEENRRLAAVQERTRIARDIHDHLGADLSRLAAQLDRAAETGPPHPAVGFRDSAQQAVRTLDELVWATNPEQDTVEGLAGYLAEFAPAFLEPHGLACELDFPTDLPATGLPARARHHLFLVAKEALRNVVRHAGATRVRVALRLTAHSLCLTIEDDGRGLEPEDPAGATIRQAPVGGNGHGRHSRSGGNGLNNMRARTAELGAKLVTEPGSPAGTRVSVTLPLADRSPPANPRALS